MIIESYTLLAEWDVSSSKFVRGAFMHSLDDSMKDNLGKLLHDCKKCMQFKSMDGEIWVDIYTQEEAYSLDGYKFPLGDGEGVLQYQGSQLYNIDSSQEMEEYIVSYPFIPDAKADSTKTYTSAELESSFLEALYLFAIQSGEIIPGDLYVETDRMYKRNVKSGRNVYSSYAGRIKTKIHLPDGICVGAYSHAGYGLVRKV